MHAAGLESWCMVNVRCQARVNALHLSIYLDFFSRVSFDRQGTTSFTLILSLVVPALASLSISLLPLIMLGSSLLALAAAASVALAFPGGAGSTTATTIFQFPDNGSWIENLAVRPNGHILVTRIDVPELWSVDPSAGTASLVHDFAGPGVTSLLGIAAVRRDVYAVVGANQSAAFAGERSAGFVFTVGMRRGAPKVKTAARVQRSGFLNGIAHLAGLNVLVADSAL
ncbi:MAG: hypothetical protein INR71_10145, partial [Terriglobus roseus]|nr:hypothetical protein [Terriglobus roseus]